MEKNTNPSETNWDEYYGHTAFTAYYSRFFMRSVLRHLIKRHILSRGLNRDFSILEIGGGNSCVFKMIAELVHPERYGVLDKNEKSLQLLQRKTRGFFLKPEIISGDILKMDETFREQFDLVFSIGLIEHFSEDDTQKAVQHHLDCVKPGGFLILFFPTSTLLYRITRYLAEELKLWIFFDERPVRIKELSRVISQNNVSVLESGIIYPMILTQSYIVMKKEY